MKMCLLHTTLQHVFSTYVFVFRQIHIAWLGLYRISAPAAAGIRHSQIWQKSGKNPNRAG